MIVDKLKIALVSSVALMALSGCGGSDDSTAGGTTPGTTFATLDVPAAEATADNAVEAVDIIFDAEGISDIGGILAVSDTQDIGFDSASFAMKVLNDTRKITNDTHALNQTFSDSFPCTDGGTISSTESSTSTSANVTLSYNNCSEFGITSNGTMTASFTGTNYGETISSMSMTFTTDYTSSGAYSETVHAGSYLSVNFTTPLNYTSDAASGTVTSSIWFEELGENMRYDDLIIDFSEDGFGNGTECYRNGRIYINNLAAYMDIDSTYDTSCTNEFVITNDSVISGSTRLLGSNGSTVLVQVIAPDTFLATDDSGNTLQTTN